jgi:thiol-disulfide isomerase/thioredoxin
MKLIILVLTCIPFVLYSQAKDPDILGVCSVGTLASEPYSAWYSKGFSEYNPNALVLADLKKKNLSRYKVTIVFGSWCGDSKREVPRMTKLLSQLNVGEDRIKLIGVDDSIAVYKQAPGGLVEGLGVYRVPTLIVYDGEAEVGRIVEYPVESLERDLKNLLARNYRPNYFSYPVVGQWINSGLLLDENVSARGLAMQLLGKVHSESELNSCGYVLMATNKLKEAIMVMRVNANLFNHSSNCFDSLGEAYFKAGQTEKAVQAYEAAVRLDPANVHATEELKKLKKT